MTQIASGGGSTTNALMWKLGNIHRFRRRKLNYLTEFEIKHPQEKYVLKVHSYLKQYLHDICLTQKSCIFTKAFS